MGTGDVGALRLVFLLVSSLAAAGGATAVKDGATDQTSANLVSADCVGLGFTGLNRCSDCDSLREFTKNDAVTAECKRCCAKDSSKAAATYDEARLFICK